MPAQPDDRIVHLDDHRGVVDGARFEITCANPRCDVRFTPVNGPGRKQTYHSTDCRKTALRDRRRLESQLAVLNQQAGLVRAQLAAYNVSDDTTADGAHADLTEPSNEEWAIARDAVAAVGGMSRFLVNNDGEFAADLLDLYRAVEPVVRRRR
ncbi:hypothetical protein [Gordonia otitidis]|uniref:Uncharacterized protein n=1 Tax=Gordonia otitidis (strain DSM 44809 / CCUG 52243 / JCM 12355 / NBRC 100426 / IFM 10032) TaxID=1108044 RepID=H5TS44_GORO1|nr:hypothetical protein [Gordonia otitidis]GAB36302.1 hypothetical protein GOOTI_206_00350 [Gordonia otitidis NBRC 100426]